MIELTLILNVWIMAKDGASAAANNAIMLRHVIAKHLMLHGIIKSFRVTDINAIFPKQVYIETKWHIVSSERGKKLKHFVYLFCAN